MPLYYVTFLAVLMTSLSWTAYQPSCSGPWFGEKCRYRCRCQNDAKCSMDGQCPPGLKCERRYFGPGCQSEDIGSQIRFVQQVTNNVLADENDQTCLGSGQQWVNFTIYYYLFIQLAWVRLTSNNAGVWENVEIQINSVPCENMKLYQVSPLIADVFCDNTRSVLQLQVRAEHLCTVEFTMGHNVALRMPTNMSSQYQGFSSDKNVDGSHLVGLDQQSCIHTKEDICPWWELYFAHPQAIHMVIILSRGHQNVSHVPNMIARSKGIRLSTTDPSGTVTTHPFDSDNPISMYTVFFAIPALVIKLKVYMSYIGNETTSLQICEVESYGVTWCPDGKYGLWCQHICQCATDQTCNPISGGCASAHCPQGKWGPKCTMTCATRCLACSDRQGKCTQCKPGYLGDECQLECKSGFYGLNCEARCNDKCDLPCQNVDGTCKSCKPGYLGHNCHLKCPKGFHGRNCSRPCPVNCLQEDCNPETGDCISCIPNYALPTCEECVARQFGDNCTDRCPRYCGINPCDRDSGICLRCTGGRVGNFCEDCTDGFYGPMCTIKCPSSCVNQTCEKNMGICFGCSRGYEGEFCTIAIHENQVVLTAVSVVVVLIIALLCYLLMSLGESVGPKNSMASDLVSPLTSATTSSASVAGKSSDTSV